MRYIVEATRNQLISKSKKGARYKHGQGNRWTAKSQCRVANKVIDYNEIDMNNFWKNDILKFNITVAGKTNTYTVAVELGGTLEKLKRLVRNNQNKFNADIVYTALLQGLNGDDIKISCSCPDYKYRFQYWSTKEKYNAGKEQNTPTKITNPEDRLGASCKHTLAILNNAEWLHKIASVITNYANYCRDKMEYNYGKFIFPKIFDMTYEKAIQMTIDDFDDKGNLKTDLDSSPEIINLSNAIGKERGKFKKGSNKNPETQRR